MQSLSTQTVFITTNGIRLHAKTIGPDNGPLIILLHGFPEFWWGWHNQMEALAEAGFKVVTPDQRGYNLSDKPKKMSAYVIDELAKDILGILDYLGYQKAIIAGHDWGAAIAWYLGMHFPERVDRIIIVNVPHPAALSQALRKPIWAQLKKSWYMLFFQVPILPEWMLCFNNFNPLLRSLKNSSRPGTFNEENLHRYIEAWSQPGGLTGGINWYRAARLGQQSGQKAKQHNFQVRVKVPTLILWGDQDAFLERFLADWSLEWVEDGQLVRFSQATHWILHEEAAHVNQIILQFLDKSSQPHVDDNL